MREFIIAAFIFCWWAGLSYVAGTARIQAVQIATLSE